VGEGETLTEFQLLEGLLLPSGDNLAVLLADWVAGSEPEFTTRMNRLAATLHLDATHFADSSGLNPASVSSARDLVTLTASAMANPVFRAIVALPEVSLPLAGTVRNYNPVLGQQGVSGVKTGWTAAALGCLVFSADATVSGHPVALVGAVLGQPGGPMSGLVAAGRSALALLRAGLSQLRAVSLPLPGQAVARIKAAWAPAISVKPARRLSLVARAGSRLRLRLATRRLSAPFRRGARVGTLSLTTPGGFVSRLPLVTAGRLRPPSWQWRLTRPW
ncbi:MAG TPA: D-alanyl-D-alanine carboxypeptidase, partial [Candidatus Dormibacteraeota bacterium]